MTNISMMVRAVAAAAALVLVGQAHAVGGPAAASTNLVGYGSAAVGSLTPATTTTAIDVAGIASYDEYGSPANTVLTFNLGANALVTGIGWDVSVTAISPSWLSELSIALEDSAQSAGVFLSVGTGFNDPGSESFSSGGVLALADYGLEFNVGADGVLRLEFFEGFLDPISPNGTWDSGFITVESVAAVPEPSTYGMMALGLLAVGGMIRRRRR